MGYNSNSHFIIFEFVNNNKFLEFNKLNRIFIKSLWVNYDGQLIYYYWGRENNDFFC